METPSRRSDHSCDQCRKGKRRCDAPTLHDDRPDSCSNCKRYKKDCTFQWLSTRKHSRQQRRKKAAGVTEKTPSEATGTPATACQSESSNELFSAAGQEKLDITDTYSWSSPWPDEKVTQLLDTPSGLAGPIRFESEDNREAADEPLLVQMPDDTTDARSYRSENLSGSISEAMDNFVQLEQAGLAGEILPHNLPIPEISEYQIANRQALCALSDQTAREYARSSMTKNLIRIYHDSMENALSCWLTERNCPYSRTTGNAETSTGKIEWGPTFSNRICTRVCRLDYAAASIRGRSLSTVEDKNASRALHKSILAFASQWSQNFQKEKDLYPPNPSFESERSLRDALWSDARHALENSVGIPSFRIVFANILFSLTQRPIKDEEDLGLNDIIEKDYSYTFLESAVRQMLSFRYKNAQTRPGLRQNTQFPEKVPDTTQSSSQKDFSLAEHANHDTFDLLFWLGVMFDTQISAMHQRPPVVSDEDSQKASESVWRKSSSATTQSSFDLDGFSLSSRQLRQKNRDLWDDFLLYKASECQTFDKYMPAWPFSHEKAAEILSDAAPVKVLLWRRITQLQTLIYREAEPEVIEECIQKALLVYRHWNNTYNNFILNCVSNHDVLPPRVQSWYVVLAAHWHLGAMLLADVIDNIDKAQLSLDHQRESRNAIEFAGTLRMNNASAVVTLARCSMYENESMKPNQFHDSLNDAAFLTEPFTVLLIHSFAKSGYIFLENLQISLGSIYCGRNESFDRFRQGCEVCIRALRFLGRKSDMASLVARGLSNKLNTKLKPDFIKQSSLDFRDLRGIESYPWASDLEFDWAMYSSMNNDTWM